MEQQNNGNTVRLECNDCGTTINHPVGSDGDKGLCPGCTIDYLRSVGLL